MKKYRGQIGKAVIFLFPLICGMAGFWVLDREPFLDSLYTCVAMYLLNYGGTPANILEEIARWTAPLVTASGVIMAVSAFRVYLSSRMKYLRGDSVAVYGPEDEKETMLALLGRRGIDGGEDLVLAQRYIFLGAEEENLAFYNRYREKLKDKKVYLKCSSIREQAAEDAGLKLFCPEETAARLFWKQHSLYEESVEKNHRLKLVFLGFGKLGQEVLEQGLLNNIFSPDQRIEYHVFGDGEEFAAIHGSLSCIGDPVVFHEEPWYQSLELLRGADRILVLTQEEQAGLLSALMLALGQIRLTVFAGSAAGTELLKQSGSFEAFYWEEVCSLENILEDLLFERAKRINLRYAALYQGVEETEEEKEKQWKALDAFTRYSNISSADYHEVRLYMLKTMGLAPEAGAIPPKILELLAELEHIRWCRYHYLNNWSYGIPAEGKNKDKRLRIHTDLIPYGELSEEDKEKDRENIRILLSVSDT